MDRLCDNLVEEILRRLPAKCLHRVRAAARRYNHIVLSPEFRARYWESNAPHLSGVFLQSNRPWWQHSLFLTGSSDTPSAATESIVASDLAFLPQLPPGPAAKDREIFIVHSRGDHKPVQYYVCNPVSWQCVALPELPSPSAYLSGLLSVTTDGDGAGSSCSIKCFQVVLFSHPSSWKQSGGVMDLKVYSSATGRWEANRIQPPPASMDVETHAAPSLGQSGTAYWIGYRPMDKLIAYSCLHHTVQVLPLPSRVHDTTALNRCIGERQGGGLRYAHFDCSVFQGGGLRYAHFDCSVLQVWDLQAGGGVDGVWWKMVHQVGVMELMAERNPEATGIFTVLGFHPTRDIVFLEVNQNVAAYSIEHGTITYQCPHRYFPYDVFPYVHPAHPVEIPEVGGSIAAGQGHGIFFVVSGQPVGTKEEGFYVSYTTRQKDTAPAGR
uniref:Uncharacterized protein n=1 Tax=Avena sativa TaxID=4498 RepID=A0ACD5VB17_AVESA